MGAQEQCGWILHLWTLGPPIQVALPLSQLFSATAAQGSWAAGPSLGMQTGFPGTRQRRRETQEQAARVSGRCSQAQAPTLASTSPGNGASGMVAGTGLQDTAGQGWGAMTSQAPTQPTDAALAGKANAVNWFQPSAKSTSIDWAPVGLRSCDL